MYCDAHRPRAVVPFLPPPEDWPRRRQIADEAEWDEVAEDGADPEGWFWPRFQHDSFVPSHDDEYRWLDDPEPAATLEEMQDAGVL
jgi:hypothetical protein